MKYKVEVWSNGEFCSTYKDDDIQSLVAVCKEDWEYEFSNARLEFYVYEDDIEISDEDFRLKLGIDN